ncbi:MAG TPA: hypothetical protein VKJ45_00285 [Blastocatellia bacterium]|nr:hypothetical protein [Blastocatellia bacterium]
MDGIALFFKATVGGILLVLFAWIFILTIEYWRFQSFAASHGFSGLGAQAGGWTMLMNSPFVVACLAIAFGIGFFLTVRLLSH